MGFTLAHRPGFADVPDSVLDADDYALGIHLARISENAAFGMVRLEVFEGFYKDGETVPLPVSKADGYTYSRDECIYIWGLATTCNPKTNWASYASPWTMWFAGFNVNQATGEVSCAVGYRGNQDHTSRQASTTDGILKVWTIAQRQRTSLYMSKPPTFLPVSNSDIVADAPLKSSILTALNSSAKDSVINVEVIYMGEFKNGDVVPSPVSPVDGHMYVNAAVVWHTSLRWTMDDDGATPPTAIIPAISKGQLRGWTIGVNPDTRAVTTKISYESYGVTEYDTGRVAVFAICIRQKITTTLVIDGRCSPWKGTVCPVQGENTSPCDCATVPVTPGEQVSVQYLSGLWSVSHPIGTVIGTSAENPYGSWDADGEPGTTRNGYHSENSTAAYWINEDVRSAMLVGAWVNSEGNVVGNPFAVGLQRTLTVPTDQSISAISLGMCDGSSFSDNSGSITVAVTQNGFTLDGNDFGELDPTVFLPGTLRASTLMQVKSNVEEAWLSPEIFGPVEYGNGDIIPLPTSVMDGYQYKRDELYYLWERSTQFPMTNDDRSRLTCDTCSIDQLSGLVTINTYEDSTSSDGYYLNHDGKLRVTVIATRSASTTSAVVEVPKTQPQDNTGTTSTNVDDPAQIQSDWSESDTAKVDFIKNKPTFSITVDGA